MNGLRYIRNEFNMSIAALAKRMGVSYQAISQWEKNIRPIPPKRLDELATLFDIPAEYFAEIETDKLQTLEGIIRNVKCKSEDSYWFTQHEEALHNERNLISRIDYHLKGKGREFIAFEDLIAFIDGETAEFNRIMDIVATDALRPVLYAMVRSFDIAVSEDNRTNRLILLKKNINELLDNAIENAQAYEYIKAAHDEDLY